MNEIMDGEKDPVIQEAQPQKSEKPKMDELELNTIYKLKGTHSLEWVNSAAIVTYPFFDLSIRTIFGSSMNTIHFDQWALYSSLGITLLRLTPSIKAKIFDSHRIKKEDMYADPIGFTATRLNYSGKESLTAGEVQLKKGDEVIFASLPIIQNEDKTNLNSEDISNYGSLIQYAGDKIQERFKDTNYKAVVLEVPKIVSGEVNAKPYKTADFLTAKNPELVYQENNDYTSFILTSEQLKELTTSNSETFLKAAHLLDDEEITYFLFNKQHNAKYRQDKVEAKLKKILIIEREKIISDEFHKDQFGTSKRINVQTSIKKINGRDYFVENRSYTNENGEEINEQKKIRIEDAFQMSELSTEKILKDFKSKHKRGRYAYSMYSLLQTESIDKLTTPQKNLNQQELSEKFKNHFAFQGRFPTGTIDHDATYRKVNSKAKVLNALAIGVIINASIYTASLGLQSLKDVNLMGNSENTSQDGSALGFGRPPQKPEVKVESYNMSTAGLWIQSTSSRFIDGQWLLNDNVKQMLDLPLEYKGDEPTIFATKKLATNLTGEASYKLPIKDHTKISAIRAIDSKGNPVSFTSLQMDDGTIKVLINSNSPKTVLIKWTLTPSEENQIKAVKKVKKLDINKVSQRVRNLVNYTKATSSEDEFDLNLAKTVRNTGKYSVNPKNNESINVNVSNEELLNQLIELKNFQCNVSTALLVFLSALNEGDLNVAVGYMNNDSNLGSLNVSSGYLNSLSAHAVAVDPKGRLIDPTAQTPADDEETKQYLKEVKEISSDSQNKFDEDYEKETLNINLEITKLASILTSLQALAAAGSMAGAFGAYKSYRNIVSRVNNNREIEGTINKIVFSTLSEKELEKAYEFFTYLIKGNNVQKLRREKRIRPLIDDFGEIAPTLTMEQKKEALTRIRNNNFYKAYFDQYLQNPGEFEKNMKLSLKEKSQIRFLARYMAG